MNSRLAKGFTNAVQRARGWDYRAPLRELEELQWASPERVREHRLGKLRSLLAHCREHVPFYKDQLGRLGIEPATIEDEKDIRALPVVTKRMLREDYGRFCATKGNGGYDVWTSSGSTGEPFPFRMDKRSIAANVFAALARGRRWWEMDFGVREGMIWSGVRDVSGTRSGRLAAARRRFSWRLKNIRLVDIYDLDHRAVRRAYQMFLRFKPVLVRAISSGLFRFCECLEELGLDGRRLGVRRAIYTGESLLAAQRALIERVLGCKTICEYGCTELGVIAFECPKGGIHLNHENLVAEYLKDGRPAAGGQEAELVVTDLNNHVAPLVRYAVGDIVVPTDQLCECGRRLPLLLRIEGRTHDAILTPQGSIVHGLYFTHIFDRLPIVHQFRVVQERIDLIRLELRSPEGIPDSVKQSVQAAVAKVMGGVVSVVVEQVVELPVSKSGKSPWIVSRIDGRGCAARAGSAGDVSEVERMAERPIQAAGCSDSP